nr:hypothetical protein [uncultured Desulfobacter sp.]
MMLKVPTDFLVVLSLIIDFFLIFLLFLFIRRANSLQRTPNPGQANDLGDIVAQTREKAQIVAKEVLTETAEMIEPILEASKEAAVEFERLVQEKQALTRKLDKSMDSKIISINLLLSRASTLFSQLENQHNSLLTPQAKGAVLFHKETDVLDQQQRILDLYYQKMDVDTIAERLSIPKGEVALVIDLKEKFIAMEKAR